MSLVLSDWHRCNLAQTQQPRDGDPHQRRVQNHQAAPLGDQESDHSRSGNKRDRPPQTSTAIVEHFQLGVVVGHGIRNRHHRATA
ncbi:Uncharacterised protein [Vibrio cholerae]|nr:Uncharacterised protein [Vibrio cholerae]CSB20595.1 Uncharacterised protein [Vibrio cholerae]CSC72201.1 Uncharacterised protein [Vibrio cholerae]